ncbi:DUF6035 family protein [Parasphingorhabdus halotolerans]|uniref:DUF6035 domain-containing protein n=1 Tax=Parasphingorhabdus halotolerans TaxID=2725558 RepID=A0A6H2DNS5_9SPHN|nr:DUF6035 family protein [Parasphingorhabdus halotolerans]QJB69787.1 hypothetical protein HF685_11270 [Parasphingorhabdus halotolerans]
MSENRIRLIERVVDLENLESISASQLLDFNKGREVRAKADKNKRSKCPIVCARCENSVVVPMHWQTGEYYFKHFDKFVECPWTSEGSISIDQANARIFQGQQEGPLHKKLKEKMALSLAACPDVPDIWVDEIYNSRKFKEHKKPDIRFVYKDRTFVFEIQLATTQRPIITKRNKFYQREGFSLLWITSNPEPKALEAHKASVVDIITDHNDNLFSVDDETFRRGDAENTIVLRVHWWEGSECKSKIVKLDDLIYPEDGLPYAIEKPKPWNERWKDSWVSITPTSGSIYRDRIELWESLIGKYDLDTNADDLEQNHYGLIYLLNLLLSIERKMLVGTKQKNLTEVLNTFFSTESRQPFARIAEYFLKKANEGSYLTIQSTQQKLNEARQTEQIDKTSLEAKIVRVLFPKWT